MAKAKQTPTDDTRPETKLEAATLAAVAEGKHGRELAYDLFQRDEKGLLKNVNYVFLDDGTIDWKRMIPKKYLVINSEYFEKRQMAIPDSTDGLEDKQLLILLGGIKELAKIRGIKSVSKRVIECSADRAVVICGVEFIGNYETGGERLLYEEVANATTANTNSFSQFFLETIASNRAFVRAVRNALRLDIVGTDELSSIPVHNNEVSGAAEPHFVLQHTTTSSSFPYQTTA
jgi:hypothetical protein